MGECRGGCIYIYIYMHVRMDRKEQAVDTEMGWGMGVNRQFEGSPTAAFFGSGWVCGKPSVEQWINDSVRGHQGSRSWLENDFSYLELDWGKGMSQGE